MVAVIRFTPGGFSLAMAALIGIAALVVLLRRDRLRGRPGWRAVAWSLAVAGLWGLFARPSVRGAVEPARAVLLTAGATQTEVDRLARDHGNLRFSIARGGPVTSSSARYVEIPDAIWIARHHPEIAELAIGGEGLDAWDLGRLPFAFKVDAERRGALAILEARWPREVVLGRAFDVRLRLEGTAALHRLRLIGPAGEEASATADELSGAEIALGALPRRVGRAVYRVEALDRDGQVVFSEPVGVSVVSAPKRRVLWLEASPSFETRHVKNWLAGSGSELVIRSRISRGRFRTELVNAPSRNLASFGRGGYGEFDLVILDRASLADLSKAGRDDLLAAAASEAVGILVLAASGAPGELEAPFDRFAFETIESIEELSVRPQWAGTELDAELRIDPRVIRAADDQVPLIQDAAGRVLAAAMPHGRGLLGVSLLRDSFRWSLAGRAEAVGGLWSRLVEEISRRRSAPVWRFPEGPILVDRPLDVEVLVADLASELPRFVLEDAAGRMEIAARQDPSHPESWSLRLWPRVPGWHSLSLDPDAMVWFHAAGPDAWPAWVRAQRRLATRAAALGPPRSDFELQSRWRGVSRIPLFACVLGGFAAVWLDERRRRRFSWADPTETGPATA